MIAFETKSLYTEKFIHRKRKYKSQLKRLVNQVFLKRNGDLRVDKIPLETSPINKAFKTFEDQGADQCNVKRSKGRSRARFSFTQKLSSTKTKSQNIYTCFTFIEQFGATMTNQVQNNLKKTHQKETFDQVGPWLDKRWNVPGNISSIRQQCAGCENLIRRALIRADETLSQVSPGWEPSLTSFNSTNSGTI